MADGIPRLLLQMQGWAALLESNHEDAMRWIAEFLNGHPKAQDFEPTGHGGSDPTSVNGIRPDQAAQDGKDYEKHIRAAWRSLDAAVHISKKYQTAERPKPGPIEDEFCVMHYKYEKTPVRYRGTLCRPCYDHRGDLAKQGLELTDEEVRYHATYGKWPKGRRVDPKQHSPAPMQQPAPENTHIARLDRLKLGTEALPDPTERKAI